MDSLQAFWDAAVSVYQTGFLGQPVGRGLAAVGVLVLFYILRHLISHFFVGMLKTLVGRTETKFDDKILDALEQPLTLVPIAAGIFFAGEVLGLEEQAREIVLLTTQSLLVFLIFWALSRLSRPAIELLTGLGSVFGPTLVDWLAKLLRALFFFVGVAAVLDMWGVPVLPFLASLSLLSVAVALGAQDLFKNLIAGALIIAERRFGRGDWIKVDGVVEGTVEQISFRSTMVRRFDKAPVHVPNSALSDNSVTNFSRMTHRRIYWVIGLVYGSTVEQLAQVRNAIETHILESDDFAHPPEVTTFVRVDQFSDSSIDIMLYCFTRTTDWVKWLTIKESLAYRIKEIVAEAGTDFAFPSQSVYLETEVSGARPEVFDPEMTPSSTKDVQRAAE